MGQVRPQGIVENNRETCEMNTENGTPTEAANLTERSEVISGRRNPAATYKSKLKTD